LSLKDYNIYCKSELEGKIPDWKNRDWRRKVGDCIYNYSNGDIPSIRKSVHNESNRKTDLGGMNSLLSTHYFFFGEKAVDIPEHLHEIIKLKQGHRKVENIDLIIEFEKWIEQFQNNRLYADPQLKYEIIEKSTDEIIAHCSKRDKEEDEDETEETI